MDEDGVLDLTQSRFLDPPLPIQDLADDVTLLIPRDPGLILETVVRLEGQVGDIVELNGGVVLVLEQLPWSKVTVVQAMEDHTHSLPTGDESGDTDKVEEKRDGTPPSIGTGQSEEEIDEDAKNDDGNTQATSEDDARSVAVADGPTDEIRVCLAPQRPFNS